MRASSQFNDFVHVNEVGSSEGALLAGWNALQKRIVRVALRFTRDLDQADDLVQEALIELWLIDPSRFDLKDATELAFLRRLLVRRMMDVWRKERRRGITRLDETEDEPEDDVDDERDCGASGADRVGVLASDGGAP